MILILYIIYYSYRFSVLPAIQAFVKHAIFPVIIALSTMEARSDFRLGAIAPRPPSWMPMELKLAKLHKAYVAITIERS